LEHAPRDPNHTPVLSDLHPELRRLPLGVPAGFLGEGGEHGDSDPDLALPSRMFSTVRPQDCWVHHRFADAMRRSAREGIAGDFDNTWPGPASATDPAGGLSLRDLDRALAQIPEERREVILLIGLEGISYEEASTILDVAIGTIRSRLSRGRESLRTLMDLRDQTESGVAITSGVPKRRRLVPQLEPTQNSRQAPA
jgi:hypothetical protein